MTEQMYVEELTPASVKHPYPIIFWHGMGQTGSNWLTTPDGRPGWASYFLSLGYKVFLVDVPERGRSAWESLSSEVMNLNAEYAESNWTATRHNGDRWPQAGLHTQWPGTGQRGDPSFDQFMACQIQSRRDYLATEMICQQAGAELLSRVGPAILCTHSQGGSHGWAIADVASSLIKAIVALEPIGKNRLKRVQISPLITPGPPFVNRVASALGKPDPSRIIRPYGLTVAPLEYDPPITKPSELSTFTKVSNKPEVCDQILQEEPARRLPNLARIPILIVTSEAGYHAHYDHATVEYLRQAGVAVDWLDLPEVGIKGNGHFMFMERNSNEIAEHVHQWLLNSSNSSASDASNA